MGQASDAPTRAPFDTPGPYLVIPEFLGAATVARLLGFAAAHEGAFKPSRTGHADETPRVDASHRRSLRLSKPRAIEPLVRQRFAEVRAQVFAALGCGAFDASASEIELVAHGDGDFFGSHVDTFTGEDQARSARMISMVYYFCRTPRPFSGGQLRLHSLAASGRPGTFVDIEPENDTALFFLSWFPHEVLPVVCESGRFLDSRFTINCWVYK